MPWQVECSANDGCLTISDVTWILKCSENFPLRAAQHIDSQLLSDCASSRTSIHARRHTHTQTCACTMHICVVPMHRWTTPCEALVVPDPGHHQYRSLPIPTLTGVPDAQCIVHFSPVLMPKKYPRRWALESRLRDGHLHNSLRLHRWWINTRMRY